MGAGKGQKQYRYYRKYLLFFLFVLVLAGLVFLYVKGNSSDSKQVKIGATYMTMNNDFYKTLNAEIEKKTNQQGSRIYVRDPELDEDKQSQQIDILFKKE